MLLSNSNFSNSKFDKASFPLGNQFVRGISSNGFKAYYYVKIQADIDIYKHFLNIEAQM